MGHPQMFDEADPVLARVREICLAMPQAQEKTSHGRPNFFTRKVFASYGGVVKGDHHSDTHAASVLILPDADHREALLAEPHTYLPAYVGVSGWVGVDLSDDVDWDEIAELVDESYRNTAPVTMIRQLDDRG
ncbi:MmcQ/YjbR family DNA-binding protein [Propionibacteriaceae bacterium Y1685]